MSQGTTLFVISSSGYLSLVSSHKALICDCTNAFIDSTAPWVWRSFPHWYLWCTQVVLNGLCQTTDSRFRVVLEHHLRLPRIGRCCAKHICSGLAELSSGSCIQCGHPDWTSTITKMVMSLLLLLKLPVLPLRGNWMAHTIPDSRDKLTSYKMITGGDCSHPVARLGDVVLGKIPKPQTKI